LPFVLEPSSLLAGYRCDNVASEADRKTECEIQVGGTGDARLVQRAWALL